MSMESDANAASMPRVPASTARDPRLDLVVMSQMLSSRLLKKAHLLRWHARALAAAYLKYAWTHLRWVPRPSRAALHLDLFEQPG
jgi:hypothetical protein